MEFECIMAGDEVKVKKENAEKLIFNSGIILVLSKADRYSNNVLKLLEYFINDKNEPGVYVTLSKPYVAMKKFLENRVDLRMLIFIDAFAMGASKKPEKIDGVLFLHNAEDLTGMSLALDQAVKSIPGKQKFVFFDSLSTLLIYNKSESVARFIHFLTCKIRIWEIDAVFISLEEEEAQVINKLKMYCDDVIHLDSD